MPATVRAVGTTAGNLANLTLTYPTREDGDILLLFVETSSGQPVTTVTAGSGGGTWTQVTSVSGTDSVLGIWWSRWTTGQASQLTVTDTGDHQMGVVISVSGCVTTGTPFQGLATATAASTTSGVIPAVTTTLYNTEIIGAITSGRDANSTTEFSNYTNSSLLNINEEVDYLANTGNGGGFGIFSAFFNDIGSTGTTSVTIANATATSAAAFAMIGTDSTTPFTGWGVPV
jgi:hypothetical protein